VERESQAPIVLGRGGAAIKGLGSAARTQIEEFLGRKVFLQLSVQVGWVLGVGGCLLHAAVTAPKKDTG
jgi:GTPase Era involved in 16S rRNA processing